MGENIDKTTEKALRAKTLKTRIFWVCIVYTVIKLILTAFHFFYAPAVPRTHNFNRSDNAAWIRHQWFSEPQNSEQTEQMARMLEKMQISTVFIHVGPMDSRGNIPLHDRSIWLENRRLLKNRMPSLKILAWLGGVNASKFGPGDDTLNLADERLLSSIADTAGILTDKCRFDGVHLNIEPLSDNETAFVELLQRIRRKTGGRILSVASPHIIGYELMADGVRTASKGKVALWGPAFYRRVAANCDQIALMGYDSINQTDATYKKFIAYQIKHISEALQGTSCKLLVGLPTYEEKTFCHNPKVETLKIGLEGTIIGLSRTDNTDVFQGVAIYALWTTDEGEISQYQSIWPPKPEISKKIKKDKKTDYL